MIDVHPAHHAASTWRDFFIHIATIALGLLLAVGLEQIVEAVHHHREREELIAAIRAEAQYNRAVFEKVMPLHLATLTYYVGVVAALKQATPHNGMVDVVLPTYHAVSFDNPARATWAIAKTNGKVALLPDNLAETYNHLDRQAELEYQAREAISAPGVAASGTGLGLGLGLSLTPGARLHLSVADRDALVQARAQLASAYNADFGRMADWQGANNAVADGVQSRETMLPYITRAVVANRQAVAKALAQIASENSPTSHAAQESKP